MKNFIYLAFANDGEDRIKTWFCVRVKFAIEERGRLVVLVQALVRVLSARFGDMMDGKCLTFSLANDLKVGNTMLSLRGLCPTEDIAPVEAIPNRPGRYLSSRYDFDTSNENMQDTVSVVERCPD